MPIERDLSGVGTAPPEGRPPDEDMRFLPKMLELWFDDWRAKDAPPSTGRFRASNAGVCTRELAYVMTSVPESNPPSLSDAWRMGIGTVVHEKMDELANRVFGLDVKVEVRGVIVDVHGGFTADFLIEDPKRKSKVRKGEQWTTMMELKSANGFSFKLGTTDYKGPPEGPKRSHSIQGALCAEGLQADEMVVGWVALEVLSKDWQKRNALTPEQAFLAEWTYTRDEYLAIAARERKRVNWLMGKLEEWGEKAVAEVPVQIGGLRTLGAVGNAAAEAVRQVPRIVEDDTGRALSIVNPANGLWEILSKDRQTILDSGTTWHCGYCRHQDYCVDQLAIERK